MNSSETKLIRRNSKEFLTEEGSIYSFDDEKNILTINSESKIIKQFHRNLYSILRPSGRKSCLKELRICNVKHSDLNLSGCWFLKKLYLSNCEIDEIQINGWVNELTLDKINDVSIYLPFNCEKIFFNCKISEDDICNMDSYYFTKLEYCEISLKFEKELFFKTITMVDQISKLIDDVEKDNNFMYDQIKGIIENFEKDNICNDYLNETYGHDKLKFFNCKIIILQ